MLDVDQIRPLAALEHQRPARHADAEIAVDPARDLVRTFGNQRRRTLKRHARFRLLVVST